MKNNKKIKELLKQNQINEITESNEKPKKKKKNKSNSDFEAAHTSKQKLPKYPLITNFNDEYCEILYQSYDKYNDQKIATSCCILFFLLFLTNFMIYGSNYFIGKLLVLILFQLILLVFIYQKLRKLIKQPHFQPIIFQRNQGKVYIYSYDIPNEPIVYVWNWHDIRFTAEEETRNVTSHSKFNSASFKETYYVCSLYIYNHHDIKSVRISQFHHKEGFFNKALTRGRYNHSAYTAWLKAYMNYQDERIEKPTNSHSCSYVWDQMASKQFRKSS